ncbi:MAG: glycosyltransferase, partial [Bacteroidia bacterium]|nr:glycosyltransferase [Bacteroidia bacterium]
MQIEELIKNLRSESVHTWFDLGLFIDRVKENRKVPGVEFKGSFRQFKNELGKGGIAFIPFHYAVDGVTVEIDKYAKSFRSIFKGITIHYIAGEIMPEANRFIHPSVKQFELKEIDGFDNWDLYKDFFFTKLQRGSDTYNELITKFWKQTLDITEKLGSYIERNNIKLLYLVNINSNPGNVCLALSTVLVSEYLGIPVINNCHDYYWEGGNRKIDIKTKGLKPGPRDFFFRNSHLGEFFSQIEVLYPWQSRTWMTVNINKNQTDHVISKFGQNPANVCEIGTAVDTNEYRVRTKRNKINAFIQVAGMLSNYKKKLRVNTVSDILSKKKFDYHDPKPILVGYKRRSTFDFINNNIVFLQPTRLMPRKRIEVAYNLVERLAEHEEFLIKLRNNPDLSITILITGPIPLGQYDYFTKLLKEFQECLRLLKPWLRERVFLGFLFSEFDKKRFTNKCTHPIDIPELYNIASLILLPSETEGRGLPIIEATACGIPIFCRRYYPENVYAEVIGEHLSEKERLKVLEYDGRKIRDKLVDDIFQRVFFPHEFMEEVEHNHKVVYKRYSLDSLKINIEKILQQLYWQMKSNEMSSKFTANQTKEYSKIANFSNKDLEYIINSNKRQYLPGSGQLYFMLLLKSLIDPSFFRVEEQLIRGLIMQFARKLVDTALNTMEIAPEKLVYFFNCV